LQTFVAGKNGTSDICFSTNGERLVSNHGGTISLWDIRLGQVLWHIKWESAGVIYCISLSPDGNKLAAGAEVGLAKLWDIQTGGELHTFEGHRSYLSCVCLSHDGKILATGGDDTKFWDVAPGQHPRSVYHAPTSPYWPPIRLAPTRLRLEHLRK